MSRNENFVKNFISNLSYEDAVAIDIGANKGMYTSLLADKFSKVYAIEPHSANISDLEKKIAGKDNVTIYRGVIGTSDGRHTLYTSGNSGGHSIQSELADVRKWGHSHDKTMEVDGMILDSFPENNVSFIKCDIEGGEKEIFFHGKKFFERNKPTIILETHQVKFEWKTLVNFFHDYGYKVYNDQLNEVNDMKFDSHYLIKIA